MPKSSATSTALLGRVLLTFLVTRCALTLVGVLALREPLPVSSDAPLPDVSGNSVIRAWARWDSPAYHVIAQQGYMYRLHGPSTVAYFPLYPLLMSGVGQCLGGSSDALYFGGIIVSNVLLLVALFFLILLVGLDQDDAVAERAANYLLLFPTTLFLSAVYPMSTMLAICVAAFYFARRQRWWIAGSIAALASMCRPDGVLLALPLAVEYFHQRGLGRGAWRGQLIAFSLIPLPLLAWMAYLHTQFGDALAFYHAQLQWPSSSLWEFVRSGRGYQGLAGAVLFIALTIIAWFKLRPSYATFCTIFLALMLFNSRAAALTRYGLILFPAFIVLAMFGRRNWFDRVFTLVSFALAAFLMIKFALWYPAA